MLYVYKLLLVDVRNGGRSGQTFGADFIFFPATGGGIQSRPAVMKIKIRES